MARKVVLIDDIDGTVIDDELGGQTVAFSINDGHYTIDLGVKNYEAFKKDMQKWVDAAEQVEAPRSSRTTTTTRRRTAGSASSGMSREQREAIRTWANSNGYQVGDRGRIKAEIVEAFEAAHKS